MKSAAASSPFLSRDDPSSHFVICAPLGALKDLVEEEFSWFSTGSSPPPAPRPRKGLCPFPLGLAMCRFEKADLSLCTLWSEHHRAFMFAPADRINSGPSQKPELAHG